MLYMDPCLDPLQSVDPAKPCRKRTITEIGRQTQVRDAAMRNGSERRFRRSIWAARRRYSLNRAAGAVRLDDPATRRLLKYVGRHMN